MHTLHEPLIYDSRMKFDDTKDTHRIPSIVAFVKNGFPVATEKQDDATTHRGPKDVEVAISHEGMLPCSSMDSLAKASAESVQLRRLSSMSTARGVMHQRSADKFRQLTTSYKSRRALQEEQQLQLPGWVVHPHDIWAQCWWTFILCTVVVTLFVEPYSLAFSTHPGLYPMNSPDTILAVIITTVYGSDVLLNFFVAYYDNAELVTDLRSIAGHYVRWRLWVDLVTTIPFDWIVLGALGMQQSNNNTAWYVSLLRLLRLGRAYRLYGWVMFLTYNQTLSFLAVTLIRNFTVCFYIVHWAACGFYYIAKQGGLTDTTWVGSASKWIGGASALERYIYSMYWSIITFATVGYGDFHAYSVAEAVFTIVYVFINIGVAAYIVGTITLLVVRGDERTGAYRERLNVLDAYSSMHDIPGSLKSAMKGHLRLHFSAADSCDEAVLAVYPTTIRCRILRHLYNTPLNQCWLFKGCKQKFVDALLAAAKVELYMPKEDIITEGDPVNELYLIVAGQATAERGNSMATMGHVEGLKLDPSDGASSVHGGSTRFLGPGDPAGEMSFFTESICLESVRTTSLCRVLVIARTVYTALVADFPLSATAIMDNLVAAAGQMVEAEFSSYTASHLLNLESMKGLELSYASQELDSEQHQMASGGHRDKMQQTSKSTAQSGLPSLSTPFVAAQSGQSLNGATAGSFSLDGNMTCTKSLLVCDFLGLPLRVGQQQVLANLLRVRALVSHTKSRLEQQRTSDFLNACSAGSLDKVRLMLQQGCDVDRADYDGRTGLMLAAGRGHNTVLQLLLVAGATVNKADHLKGCALLEAVKAGHDDAIQLLLRSGAQLMLPEVMIAAHLCTAVSDGDNQLLKRLLTAGATVDASDYDRRTALHIAAADANLPAVKLLIETGSADSLAKDRWEQTPLDEARKAAAIPIVEYLNGRVAEAASADALVKFRLWLAQNMLSAASIGNLKSIQRLLDRGCPPDVCDYDKRTGLMLAAANGHKAVVSLLLSVGANPNLRDNSGSSPLLEAVRSGMEDASSFHSIDTDQDLQLILQLKAAGAKLPLSDGHLASELCTLIKSNQSVQQDPSCRKQVAQQLPSSVVLLRRYIAAGANISAVDYDNRAPLHIAAAEGDLTMVRLLVEEGGADVAAVDRWGLRPFDEAKRVQAVEVMRYFEWTGKTTSALQQN